MSHPRSRGATPTNLSGNENPNSSGSGKGDSSASKKSSRRGKVKTPPFLGLEFATELHAALIEKFTAGINISSLSRDKKHMQVVENAVPHDIVLARLGESYCRVLSTHDLERKAQKLEELKRLHEQKQKDAMRNIAMFERRKEEFEDSVVRQHSIFLLDKAVHQTQLRTNLEDACDRIRARLSDAVVEVEKVCHWIDMQSRIVQHTLEVQRSHCQDSLRWNAFIARAEEDSGKILKLSPVSPTFPLFASASQAASAALVQSQKSTHSAVSEKNFRIRSIALPTPPLTNSRWRCFRSVPATKAGVEDLLRNSLYEGARRPTLKIKDILDSQSVRKLPANTKRLPLFPRTMPIANSVFRWLTLLPAVSNFEDEHIYYCVEERLASLPSSSVSSSSAEGVAEVNILSHRGLWEMAAPLPVDSSPSRSLNTSWLSANVEAEEEEEDTLIERNDNDDGDGDDGIHAICEEEEQGGGQGAKNEDAVSAPVPALEMGALTPSSPQKTATSAALAASAEEEGESILVPSTTSDGTWRLSGRGVARLRSSHPGTQPTEAMETDADIAYEEPAWVREAVATMSSDAVQGGPPTSRTARGEATYRPPRVHFASATIQHLLECSLFHHLPKDNLSGEELDRLWQFYTKQTERPDPLTLAALPQLYVIERPQRMSETMPSFIPDGGPASPYFRAITLQEYSELVFVYLLREPGLASSCADLLGGESDTTSMAALYSPSPADDFKKKPPIPEALVEYQRLKPGPESAWQRGFFDIPPVHLELCIFSGCLSPAADSQTVGLCSFHADLLFRDPFSASLPGEGEKVSEKHRSSADRFDEEAGKESSLAESYFLTQPSRNFNAPRGPFTGEKKAEHVLEVFADNDEVMDASFLMGALRSGKLERGVKAVFENLRCNASTVRKREAFFSLQSSSGSAHSSHRRDSAKRGMRGSASGSSLMGQEEHDRLKEKIMSEIGSARRILELERAVSAELQISAREEGGVQNRGVLDRLLLLARSEAVDVAREMRKVESLVDDTELKFSLVRSGILQTEPESEEEEEEEEEEEDASDSDSSGRNVPPLSRTVSQAPSRAHSRLLEARAESRNHERKLNPYEREIMRKQGSGTRIGKSGSGSGGGGGGNPYAAAVPRKDKKPAGSSTKSGPSPYDLKPRRR